jgi:hypothetical protein
VNEELARVWAPVLRETVGKHGRMIAGSKSDYRKAHPSSATVFNANVVTQDGKIWYGDLDLARDECKLVELARRIG